MLTKRIIPILLLSGNNLVKTRQFKNELYVGDAINTVRIFNELEVDELILLDIHAGIKNKINKNLLLQISKESFMPLVYGGGINTVEDASLIFNLGFEKISLNTSVFQNESLINDLVNRFGSQAIVCSIDIKKNFFKKRYIWNKKLGFQKKLNIIEFIKDLERIGVGEILLTFVDRENEWNGLEIDLTNEICKNISIPLIVNGGIGSEEHIKKGLLSGASAVGIGSFVVYQKKDMGVLVNFPKIEKINVQ